MRKKVPEDALTNPYLFRDLHRYEDKLRSFRFACNPKDSSR